MRLGIFHYIIRGDLSVNFWLSLFSTAVVLFVCLPIHEFAHGFVANKLGDPTAKNMGRLDMNPFAHLDPIGAMAIVLFGFGWARPVPVNMGYFKNPRKGMGITALAGPVSNVILAAIFLLLYKLVYFFIPSSAFVEVVLFMLGNIVWLNLSLATFNLVPIPPLDGSKILGAFLPQRMYYTILQYERYAILAVYLVMFSGILDRPMFFVMSKLYSGINYLTLFVDLIAKAIR